jgi:hypothetical protein
VKTVSPAATSSVGGTPELGGKSKGFEIGIRHFF